MFSIDELELPIRAANALRANNITSFEDFMNLDAKTVVSWKNCGRRTWNEIREVQEHLNYQGSEEQFWNQFCSLLKEANRMMVNNKTFNVVLSSENLLIPAKTPGYRRWKK